MNQQPWEFIVLTGERLAQVNACIEEHFFERLQERVETENPEVCGQRRDELMETVSQAAAIDGIDAGEFFEKMLRFFDAPVAVLFLHYNTGEKTYMQCTAAALQNFMLAAQAKDLGSCWLAVVTVCKQDIKALLNIPSDKELMGAVAVGVPDPNAAINNFDRPRVPANDLTTWYGM
jgi:nitroreductase